MSNTPQNDKNDQRGTFRALNPISKDTFMLQQRFQQVRTNIQQKTTLFIAVFMVVFLSAFVAYDLWSQWSALQDALLRKGEDLAIIGATTTSHLFENAIATNRLTKEDVFDRNYVRIEGSDPPRYQTKFDSFTDRNLTKIQDSFLQGEDIQKALFGLLNPSLVGSLFGIGSGEREIFFAVAVDARGYIPTHNSIYNQPLTGNPQQDRLINRSKRFFDDDVMLNAARNVEGVLPQRYIDSETGDEMWLISAPVIVNEEHWGAFVIGILMERIESRTFYTILGSGLIALLLVILITFVASYMARSIAEPIVMLRDTATALAQGDLTHNIVIPERGDEIQQLATALSTTVSTWRQIIGDLRDDSVRLSTTAAELASSAEQLTRTTTQQSDEMSRTSSAVEEMALSIREVARNAEVAAKATISANQSAQTGGGVAKNTATELSTADEIMQRLRVHSDEIGSIINLIQEIAAQTNILALNAAIEAAGAGVAGARFDVVAEEIRMLASRTHQATGEIGTLIGSVQADIKSAAQAISQGSILAKESGSSLTNIVETSSTVNDMVQAISSATSQQSRASGEIASAIDTMVGSSQQTASATRETAQIGIELSNLAERLKDTASQFKV